MVIVLVLACMVSVVAAVMAVATAVYAYKRFRPYKEPVWSRRDWERFKQEYTKEID